MGNLDHADGAKDAESVENREDMGTADDVRDVESAENRENVGNTESTENHMVIADHKGHPEARGSKRRKKSMESEWIMENRRKKKKLTGSFVAKVVAFFLFTACVMGAVVSGLATIYMAVEDFYSSDFKGVFLDQCRGNLYADVYNVREYIALGELGEAKEVCTGKNLNIALLKGSLEGDNGSLVNNPALIWAASDDDYGKVLTLDFIMQFPADSLKGNRIIGYTKLYPQTDYVFRAYFNMDFPANDRYAETYNMCLFFYNLRYLMLWVLCISIFLGLNSFLFLMCSAGHRNDAEGIQPSVFSSIPLDLHTAVFGIGAIFLLLVITNLSDFDLLFDQVIELLVFSVVVSAEALWCTFYLRELAVRMKLGGWWRNSIIYYVLRFLGRIIRLFWKGFCAVLREIPSIVGTLIGFVGFSVFELLMAALFSVDFDFVIIWMMEKVVFFPVIIYIAIMCKRLLDGSRALAEGRPEETINTSHMYGDFKECGENLNNIGQGISRAVAERMKSERLKTELITNVTHDIKTPLTSIINYANLIAEEPVENAKIAEYSEVLVRQSGRLKKLLEDLLEASKATTGNLEVELQPCEVSVILSQAIGEYQQRMDEKQLELIVTQPEQSVNIMADGRHLWRVFDNLLNNICKYAREDSRVYLSVEVAGKNVSIIFRNMSKYALNITPEELQERFVRGDRSRHMDGNGLGLSIAKSLTELQNGRMVIVTDGDLFKVSLLFEVM